MNVNPLVGTPSGRSVFIDTFENLAGGAESGWRLERGRYGARQGQLLCADVDKPTRVLTIDAPVTGRHAIYIGGYSPAARQLSIYVRLDGEPAFTILQMERHEPCYERMFFKSADLTGRRIEIGSFGFDTCIDYIEFVPVKEVPMPAATGELLGILDFADDAHRGRPEGYEAGSAIRRHADMGYTAVMWKSFAVRCEYPTKIGEVRSWSYSKEAAVKSDGGADCNHGIAKLLAKYDTMRQAVDVAHEVKIPIYGWARVNNEFSNKEHHFGPTTWFHKENPDKFQKSKDGRDLCKLSFAFPEVRKHKIDILCEIAAYGMDAIFIDVLRHPPLVQFDQPLVDAYLDKTGNDPRQMPGDGDEDWLRFRAEHSFTTFLREAKQALSRQAGRNLPLVVRTVDQAWYNLLIGCDVDTWIDQGIVDGIVFAPWCASANNYPEKLDLRPYINRSKGRIKIYGQTWRYGSGIHAESMAKDLYNQGVNGIALYESNATVAMQSMRDRLWRFARPEYLRG